ncbi:MAG: hypothetical protein ABI132_09005 [Rhodanobacteraceae bacterium]
MITIDGGSVVWARTPAGSRGYSDTPMPRRHLDILHSFSRRFPMAALRYTEDICDALIAVGRHATCCVAISGNATKLVAAWYILRALLPLQG